ncbi:MAG TPA: hypothetical protein VIP09_00480 [Dehalococcoidia bacterium]|jgi:hypothetical protein
MPGRSTDGESAVRPSANRIVALTLVAFTIALIVHALIIVIGGRDSPLRLFVTPLIGAAVIFFGLAGYPMAGRVRLSVMVGLGLLLIAGMV